MRDSQVLCIGELLWDSLPAGLFLGGAPFNVACHLHALGVPVAMVSRVGKDRLGMEALRRLGRHGISTELIQIDPERPTGFVEVTLDDQGLPEYDIVEPTAWDAIETTDGLLERAAQAGVIVFGSLTQRNPITRRTIERLCATDAFKVFDVNLRPPYDNPSVVRRSLRCADLVKLNRDELERLRSWFDLPEGCKEAMLVLGEMFDCASVCVTGGEDGAVLWQEGRWSEHPGYRVEVRDTVGAGDAFLATLLAGLIEGRSDEELLQRANLMGAYVATREGAVPTYQEEALAFISAMNLPNSEALESAAARPETII